MVASSIALKVECELDDSQENSQNKAGPQGWDYLSGWPELADR